MKSRSTATPSGRKRRATGPATAHRGPAGRTLSTRTAYTGRIFRVERDRVRMPTGHVVEMDVVRHRGSVVLIPQPAEGEIILIRQYRYVIGRWIWELPAGSLDPGERPAAAARRECREEIGWNPTRIHRVGMFYPTPGFCDERMDFYRCTGLVRPKQAPLQDPDEQIEPKTFALEQAASMVRRGDIVDMKTVLGLVLIGTKGIGIPSPRRQR